MLRIAQVGKLTRAPTYLVLPFFPDIEDKGTSGETFLAAVEYLEQEKPAVAIFENVDNAPWGKMQEYIRGRLILSERNSIKNITEIKKEQAGEFVVVCIIFDL